MSMREQIQRLVQEAQQAIELAKERDALKEQVSSERASTQASEPASERASTQASEPAR